MMISMALILSAATNVQLAASLTDIRMQLFYEASGILSSDITQDPDFVGWNVIIGEGSVKEPANDLLVAAEIRSIGEAFVKTPVKIVVTNAKGKVLASRQFLTFLIPREGRVFLPVWIPNAGCAGDVKVSVRFGKQMKSETVGLQCGE